MVYFSETNVAHNYKGTMVQGKAMTINKEWGVCTVYAKPDGTYFIAQGTRITVNQTSEYNLTCLWETPFNTLKDAMAFLTTLEQDK